MHYSYSAIEPPTCGPQIDAFLLQELGRSRPHEHFSCFERTVLNGWSPAIEGHRGLRCGWDPSLEEDESQHWGLSSDKRWKKGCRFFQSPYTTLERRLPVFSPQICLECYFSSDCPFSGPSGAEHRQTFAALLSRGIDTEDGEMVSCKSEFILFFWYISLVRQQNRSSQMLSDCSQCFERNSSNHIIDTFPLICNVMIEALWLVFLMKTSLLKLTSANLSQRYSL